MDEVRHPGTWVLPTRWTLLARAACEVSFFCLAWGVAWSFTPALRPESVFAFVVGDRALPRISVETEVALAGVVVVISLLPSLRREALAPSRACLGYAAPAALALLLPLDFHGHVPVTAWVVWHTVSVFWQDILTFGVLWAAVRRHLSSGATMALTAALFAVGHAALDPGVAGLFPLLGMLCSGGLLAWLRHRTGALHVPMIVHLSATFLLGAT